LTKLIFLGTKGEIEEFTERHQYHSSTVIMSDSVKLLLDYGMLQRYSLEEIKPGAVLITHAHPDHYSWLKKDIRTDVPVYLTKETFDYGKFRPPNAKVVLPGQEHAIGPFHWSCYRVIHSIRCPAVGFKIGVGGKTFIYNSDLVDIVEKDSILKDVDYYVGDGSSIRANLVRRRGDTLFGHARITTQINWCRKYGISHIIFTHLGKETIREEQKFAQEHSDVILAYDGMELEV
jgi:ribonuclease BN (tRNA processing enzyme)